MPLIRRSKHRHNPEEQEECEHCGNATSTLTEVSGEEGDTQRVCPDCVTDDCVLCDFCRTKVLQRAVYSAHACRGIDPSLCFECYDELYSCEQCDRRIAKDSEINEVQADTVPRQRRPVTAIWCDCCVRRKGFQCDICQKIYSYEKFDSISVDSGTKTACIYCFENGDVNWCEECDEYYIDEDHDHEAEAAEPEDEGTSVASVYELLGETPFRLRPRTAEPGSFRGIEDRRATVGKNKPHVSPWVLRQPKPLFFGVELEVECPYRPGREVPIGTKRRYAEKFNASVDRFFLRGFELDSSVPEGFEIITQPCGLDVHRQQWLFADLSGLVSHETTTCGLHVHMTKAALTKLTIGRMARFIHDPENKDFMETFARRSFFEYAKHVPSTTIPSSLKAVDRYEAFNVTPGKTVEFRLPRGTTKETTIVATVEFCYALIRFCESASSQKLKVPQFMQFIVQDFMLRDTRFLRAYLVDRGLATAQEMRLPRIAPPGTRVNPDDYPVDTSGARTYAEQALLEYAATGE